jgi:hypothetical protein
MDFNEWTNSTTEDALGGYDEVSVYEHVMAGDYDSRTDILTLLEEAFNAGVASGIDAAMDYL